VNAFPNDSAPPYLLRDRDQAYGQQFRHRVTGMGIEGVLTAPQNPWQSPFAERLIGSIRRECLNHVLVLGERHLRRILTRYVVYYHQARTHLALDTDTPDVRPIELPETGRILQMPEVGGLRHLIGYPELKPHDLRHGVAIEVLEQHHDLEQVRAVLGHARIDTTQIYASIRPPQLKRAVAFYEEQATRMLDEGNETQTGISVANRRSRNAEEQR
jgi:hypothetical protein